MSILLHVDVLYIARQKASSADPDQMLCSAASDLDF